MKHRTCIEFLISHATLNSGMFSAYHSFEAVKLFVERGADIQLTDEESI